MVSLGNFDSSKVKPWPFIPSKEEIDAENEKWEKVRLKAMRRRDRRKAFMSWSMMLMQLATGMLGIASIVIWLLK